MSWWRRKLNVTIVPLNPPNAMQALFLARFNNESAQQNVVSELDDKLLQRLLSEAIYANQVEGSSSFGVLTKLPQGSGHYHTSGVWLDRLVVDAKSRRRGVGSALLSDLCAKAVDLGYTQIACRIRFVGKEGIAFLKAKGFEEVGKSEVRGGYGGIYYTFAKNIGNAPNRSS